MANNRICVGVITGSFGVRGEARIKSFCAEPAAIADYSPLSNEDGSVSYQITLTRPVKGGFAARIKGIIDKEAADSLKGTRLFADRGDLPNLPDDEYYHADLIGLAVYDTGGQLLGKITAVHNHGAGDLLEVSGPAFKGSELLPFTSEVIPTVDLTSGRVIADPPQEFVEDTE
ncbi:MAG: 16S rRNA processing protein RimM [Rhodobacteraceae bacterium]|nr:16S rRNA processing protein RimM [Paracoccaceae bacterium]